MSSFAPHTTPSTAWAYLVVSSEQQVETLDFQRRWAKETAHQHGWHISEVFEGVSSGRDGARQLLQRLVERLKTLPREARPQRVLMIRLDRLGRGLGLEALAALAELVRLGVIVHTRQDGDYKISKASDSILPLMRIVTGGIENEARRDKARATYDRRRADGVVVGNKRPYGLQRVNGCDVAQEPQATTVRLAFELSANGYGLQAIGTRLRAIAAPKLYANGRAHVTEWTNDRVRKLLINRGYCGTLVDETLWHRVQRLRKGRPKTIDNAKHPWPLSGALQCECGRNLIGSLRGSPPRRVYRCTAVSVHGRSVAHGAKTIESQFLKLLGRLAASSDLLKQYALSSFTGTRLKEEEAKVQLHGLEQRLKRHEVEHRRIWRLNADGLLPDVHLARRLAEIDADRSTAEEDLRAIELELRERETEGKTLASASQLVAEAATLWPNAEIYQRQIAARALTRALGGLCVLEGGALRVGSPSEWRRFFKRESVQSG